MHHQGHAPQNLTYTVVNAANKKEKLALLDDVNGFFKPGEMAALMGPSGESNGCTLCAHTTTHTHRLRQDHLPGHPVWPQDGRQD